MSDQVPQDLTEVVLKDALENQTIGSALSGDTNGVAIDRKDLEYPQVVKLILDGQGGLGTGSDSLTFSFQDAADDGGGSPDTWEDTGDTLTIDNSTKRNSAQYDVSGYRRHVRIQLDADDSGQSLDSDTEVSGEYVFGGMRVQPQ